jgi:prepilin-type N-terminal cleavage/methylation domain-containing protein
MKIFQEGFQTSWNDNGQGGRIPNKPGRKSSCYGRSSQLEMRKNQHGFTLLELLIGITLSVIVLLILFAGMRLGYRSQEKGIEREEISQRMRILGDRITWLLRGAYPYTVKKPDGKIVYFMGKSDSIGFVTTSVDSYAEGPEDRAGLKWVLISADSDGLKIKENIYFLEDVLEDEGGKTYILDPSVKEIEFEYLDISEEDKEGTWRSDWEPKDKDYLPSAVKVKILFNYNDKEIHMPELVVRIEAIKKGD